MTQNDTENINLIKLIVVVKQQLSKFEFQKIQIHQNVTTRTNPPKITWNIEKFSVTANILADLPRDWESVCLCV